MIKSQEDVEMIDGFGFGDFHGLEFSAFLIVSSSCDVRGIDTAVRSGIRGDLLHRGHQVVEFFDAEHADVTH